MKKFGLCLIVIGTMWLTGCGGSNEVTMPEKTEPPPEANPTAELPPPIPQE